MLAFLYRKLKDKLLQEDNIFTILPNCEILIDREPRVLIFDGGDYSLYNPTKSDKYEKYLFMSTCELLKKIQSSSKIDYRGELNNYLGLNIDDPPDETEILMKVKRVRLDATNTRVGVKFTFGVSFYKVLQCFYRAKFVSESSIEFKISKMFIDIIKGVSIKDIPDDYDYVFSSITKIFFECYPISSSNIHSANFEFVIIPDESDKKEADQDKFKSRYKYDIGNGLYQRSPNSRNNETLIIANPPKDIPTDNKYENIRLFFRTIQEDAVLELLHCIAFSLYREVIKEEFEEKNIIFMSTGSTSDEIIPWIHISLNSDHRYYLYWKYRKFFLMKVRIGRRLGLPSRHYITPFNSPKRITNASGS